MSLIALSAETINLLLLYFSHVTPSQRFVPKTFYYHFISALLDYSTAFIEFVGTHMQNFAKDAFTFEAWLRTSDWCNRGKRSHSLHPLLICHV